MMGTKTDPMKGIQCNLSALENKFQSHVNVSISIDIIYMVVQFCPHH